MQQLTTFTEGKVPSEVIEAFVAAIIPEDDGKHFSWYLTLDDDEHHQSFCTLEGRKNTLRLDVQTVEDEEGAMPTFFHNQYFTEAEQLGKNPFQREVLRKQTSRTRESNLSQISKILRLNGGFYFYSS